MPDKKNKEYHKEIAEESADESRKRWLNFLIERFDDPDYKENPIVIENDNIFYATGFDRSTVVARLFKAAILMSENLDEEDPIVA
jgi:hypothetical protein